MALFTNGVCSYTVQTNGDALSTIVLIQSPTPTSTIFNPDGFTGSIIGTARMLNNDGYPVYPLYTGIYLSANPESNLYTYSGISVFGISEPLKAIITLYITTQGGNGGTTFPTQPEGSQYGAAGSSGILYSIIITFNYQLSDYLSIGIKLSNSSTPTYSTVTIGKGNVYDTTYNNSFSSLEQITTFNIPYNDSLTINGGSGDNGTNGTPGSTGTLPAYTIDTISQQWYTVTQTFVNCGCYAGTPNVSPYYGNIGYSLTCPIFSGTILGSGASLDASTETEVCEPYGNGGGGCAGGYGESGGDATNFASGGGGGGEYNDDINNPNCSGGLGSPGIAILYITNQLPIKQED